MMPTEVEFRQRQKTDSAKKTNKLNEKYLTALKYYFFIQNN